MAKRYSTVLKKTRNNYQQYNSSTGMMSDVVDVVEYFVNDKPITVEQYSNIVLEIGGNRLHRVGNRNKTDQRITKRGDIHNKEVYITYIKEEVQL